MLVQLAEIATRRIQVRPLSDEVMTTLLGISREAATNTPFPYVMQLHKPGVAYDKEVCIG